MTVHLADILDHLNNQGYDITVAGSKIRRISGFCATSEIKDNSIMWVKKMDAFDQSLFQGKQNLIVVTDAIPSNYEIEQITCLICKNPKSVYFETLSHFFAQKIAAKISQHACVETSKIGKNVSIGHHTFICSEVVIGDNVTIMNNVSIECPAMIGDDCIIGSGTVIGSPGFGYFETEQGTQKKVPDFGGVRIGNNVEIGANVCIDRGTLADTMIEDNVKIDNLCHIAHNVHIGRHAMVIALSLLGGSCTLEERAYIAPGALIMNQKTIGKGSLVGMGAVVTKDVPEGKVVAGVPAKVIRDN